MSVVEGIAVQQLEYKKFDFLLRHPGKIFRGLLSTRPLRAAGPWCYSMCVRRDEDSEEEIEKILRKLGSPPR